MSQEEEKRKQSGALDEVLDIVGDVGSALLDGAGSIVGCAGDVACGIASGLGDVLGGIDL